MRIKEGDRSPDPRNWTPGNSVFPSDYAAAGYETAEFDDNESIDLNVNSHGLCCVRYEKW
ncbi:hypothetical protein Halxa_3040 [Halopiger xanaduensis SH-6]|uniref:Uncharacterized protein n=1 Tax=Halopiger xanaduensis (strain DSM 18323 / JCM 14033 / SH-6) TaxID=797210 RepID=F8D5F0_HALXS|nr:hypothetical protein Halxa_3040 [Halopiger xanaduensis SH-6]